LKNADVDSGKVMSRIGVDGFVEVRKTDVVCRIYHTVILDDPYDDPPGLDSHIPDQSPQLTREQLDVSYLLSFCRYFLSSSENLQIIFVQIMFVEIL